MVEQASRTPPEGQSGEQFIEWALNDPAASVVVFSLTWCGYCRSVKALLDDLDIQHAVYDLDTSRFRDNGSYAPIRNALSEKTRSSTLPQVFIGGELVGGYSETYHAYKAGTLKPMLEKHGIHSRLSEEKR